MSERPTTVDAYLAGVSPPVRAELQALRAWVLREVPGVAEEIAYGMLAFRHAKRFLYVGAFKSHIGVYPPLTQDTALMEATRAFRNAKGNLAFPIAEPLPADLVRRVVRALAKQYSDPPESLLTRGS